MFYIYRITNLVNGKTYIGQHEYKNLNDKYLGSGVLILKAIKKYGKENFKKDIIEFNIPTLELANDFEQMYILFEKAKGKGEYNIAKGGAIAAWNKGVPMPDEQKKKLSEANKGKPSPRKGVHLSEDEKLIVSIKTKEGMTEEVRKKISEKKKGKPSPRKGSHHTEESKQKMRESHKGQVAWNKGIPMSEEQKKYMEEVREAYKKSGRKDWNDFQKEYKKGEI